MRYDKGHKETTRKRIIETAAAEFRKKGFDGIGVADIMKRAGLTHGGFYSHFSSKEDLVRKVLEERTPSSMLARLRETQSLEEAIRCYLSPGHRDHPERGCVVATLVEEVARLPRSTQDAFAARLKEGVAAMEKRLPADVPPAKRRQTALAVFAMVVGALQMSRIITDPKESDAILEMGIKAACSLAGR